MDQSTMNVTLETWLITALALTAIIVVDLVYQVRRKSEPGFKESAILTAFFLALSLGFVPFIGQVWGGEYAEEYLAGFITEYSLSIDNLFVFLIIFTKLSVPDKARRQALTVGILIALILRFIFIAIGAAAISAFSWVFYIFGAFLIYTAYSVRCV